MKISNKIIKLIKENLTEILDLRDQFSLKPDNSYVSKGDLLVQSLVNDFIDKNLPDYFLISEENDFSENTDWNTNDQYVILDPIDGTENFISGLKEWGVGISIFSKGSHKESCIYLPELNEVLISGQTFKKYKSRISGLSSSLNKDDLNKLESGYEYRIIGCSMYNMFCVIKGSFNSFQNPKGVNCWDILPGLNLALENGLKVYVDNKEYNGEILFPVKKYKVHITN